MKTQGIQILMTGFAASVGVRIVNSWLYLTVVVTASSRRIRIQATAGSRHNVGLNSKTGIQPKPKSPDKVPSIS